MKGVSLKSENIVPGWLTKKLRRLHQFSNHHPMMKVAQARAQRAHRAGGHGWAKMDKVGKVDYLLNISRVSNIESDNSQNVGLEDYNNISDIIFPYFTTPSIAITLG